MQERSMRYDDKDLDNTIIRENGWTDYEQYLWDEYQIWTETPMKFTWRDGVTFLICVSLASSVGVLMYIAG